MKRKQAPYLVAALKCGAHGICLANAFEAVVDTSVRLFCNDLQTEMS